MERIQNDISWKIGGEAGFGIMSTGAIFGKTCMRAGLHVVEYAEYPSLIRGGHNTDQVYASQQPTWSHRSAINILVALNKETIDHHLHELTPGGVIVYDTTDRTLKGFDLATIQRKDIRLYGLPLEQLAVQGGGQKLMRNSVALGATFALLSLDFEFPATIVRETFQHKGEAVAKLNVDVLRAGYDAMTSTQAENFHWDIVPLERPPVQMWLTGNDAIGLGALQAGCLFYAAYPMTPASSILHFLAEHGPKYGMVVRHAEDEIGVINEAIGAAYAGVRAMCGTAGGGFSLMTEAVGMAGMTEVGLVIIEAQRGGPSTGLPTWTEQADLRQVLHASQGDFLKIVLAPGDQQDCFELTQEAFNLAEHYQTPVIVMTDKHLAEGHASIPVLTGRIGQLDRGKIATAADLHDTQNFSRYATSAPDGVSSRSLPGTPNGLFLANSDEHDEYGLSNEDADMRQAQMDRRAKKEMDVLNNFPKPKLLGPAKADLTMVTWGSSLGACREAQKLLADEHKVTANILALKYLNPFPASEVARLLTAATVTVMVEGNQSGQLEGWIRQQTGLTIDHHLRRYDGRPFDPVELSQQLAQLVK